MIGFSQEQNLYSTRILLPLSGNFTDDANEALSRLARASTPGGSGATPAALVVRYGGPSFQDLHSLLPEMFAPGPSSIPLTPSGATFPQARIDGYQLILLAATDPNIPRILGLLWIDRTAQTDVAYDYLVVGYWQQGTRI